MNTGKKVDNLMEALRRAGRQAPDRAILGPAWADGVMARVREESRRISASLWTRFFQGMDRLLPVACAAGAAALVLCALAFNRLHSIESSCLQVSLNNLFSSGGY